MQEMVRVYVSGVISYVFIEPQTFSTRCPTQYIQKENCSYFLGWLNCEKYTNVNSEVFENVIFVNGHCKPYKEISQRDLAVIDDLNLYSWGKRLVHTAI